MGGWRGKANKRQKSRKGVRGGEGKRVVGGVRWFSHVAAAGQFPKRAAGISYNTNNIRTSLFCLLVTDNCNQIYTGRKSKIYCGPTFYSWKVPYSWDIYKNIWYLSLEWPREHIEIHKKYYDNFSQCAIADHRLELFSNDYLNPVIPAPRHSAVGLLISWGFVSVLLNMSTLMSHGVVPADTFLSVFFVVFLSVFSEFIFCEFLIDFYNVK